MIRAAPMLAPEPNSSVSSRYRWPPRVNGVAFCGVLTWGQVRWLTTGTDGFGTRFCTWLTSRTVRPGALPLSAMYSRLPSALTDIPCGW